VQPESVACVEVVPSLTVIVHVGELKPVRLIEKRPSEAAVPIATPSIVIVDPATAPCPSTRTSLPFSSARVTEIAASAAGAATRTITVPSSNTRMVRPTGLTAFLRRRSRNGFS
jgi:hypothetical protein